MKKSALHYLAIFLFVTAIAAFCCPEVKGQTPAGGVKTAQKGTGEVKFRRVNNNKSGKQSGRNRNRAVKPTGPRWISLLIISNPPGSSVIIDDETLGESDNTSGVIDIELIPGSYKILVSHSGYRSKIVELEITPNSSPESLKVTLDPLVGTLKVQTDPPVAEVYLNDDYQGVSSPEGMLEIKDVDLTKPYQLRAEKKGYVSSKKQIAITANNSAVQSIKLPPDLINLRVMTEPPEVEVYLDDSYKGTSNSEGLIIIEQVNSSLPHTLRGRKEGYRKENTVSVPPGNLQATVKLQPDPLVVSIREIKQHLSAGRLSEAFGTYQRLAQEQPDYEDLPRLLDSVLQMLQARSSNMILQTGPYGLILGLEEAQEMNRLYEQARKMRQGDSVITGLAEYWKMKYLVTKAKQTSSASERENLLRNALAVAPIVEALNSQNAYLVFDTAWVYRILGEHSSAKKGYELTQRLNPNWAYAYFSLGLMDMHAAEQERAKKLQKIQYLAGIDKFNKAINLKPDFFQAYMMLCISYGVLNMHQEAIFNGQQAVAMKPQNAYTHFALGFAYYQKGKPEYRNALMEFERALSLKEDELDQGTKSSIQERLIRIKKSLGIKK